MIKQVKENINVSADFREALDNFMYELGDWIAECKNDLKEMLPIDVHDQANFTVGWESYIFYKKDKETLDFLKMLRDKIHQHFTEKKIWKHGYWKMNEAHHGTEHFELFLANLWKLDPADQETVRQMIDAVEHLGNWSQEIPDWFSWEKGLFYKFNFGTDGIGEKGKMFNNRPDHFRCITLSLYGYKMTGEEKYLDLAERAAEKWVKAILTRPLDLPLALSQKGAIFEEKEDMNYTDFVGQVTFSGGIIDRAENFLASAAVEALLEIWQISGKQIYRLAAEKIIALIAENISDFEAGCGVDIIRKYRNITGCRRYDNKILRLMENLSPYDFSQISLEPEVDRDPEQCAGIGLRSDKQKWYEDGKPARHNPLLLSLAAEINHDRKLAARSLDIARTYFLLARQVYPHGHQHGCSSRSVSAVARGNGRENNAGVVTAVLNPLYREFMLL